MGAVVPFGLRYPVGTSVWYRGQRHGPVGWPSSEPELSSSRWTYIAELDAVVLDTDSGDLEALQNYNLISNMLYTTASVPPLDIIIPAERGTYKRNHTNHDHSRSFILLLPPISSHIRSSNGKFSRVHRPTTRPPSYRPIRSRNPDRCCLLLFLVLRKPRVGVGWNLPCNNYQVRKGQKGYQRRLRSEVVGMDVPPFEGKLPPLFCLESHRSVVNSRLICL